jgi:ABC-type multidrug transport system fused ATPase/permease subunit
VKTNARLFWLLAIFYLVDAAGYVVWNWVSYGKIEVIGSAAIAMLVFLSIFIAYYLGSAAKNQGTAPEDRLDAEVEDGDFEQGHFSPWSWWPFFLGIGCALAFASLAIGWWLFFIAFPIAIISLVRFVYEYYSGVNAH